MENLVYMKFGSHLYGTDTPESDLDFKGVYLPSKEQLILSRFPQSISNSTGAKDAKNEAGDIDDEIFSLHRFIGLACEGQTIAIDMLHAPEESILDSSAIWDGIVKNREKFYTKNLRAFVGYCRRQAAKYGVKGSRLNTAKMVFNYLYNLPDTTKMVDIWESLPNGEHIHFLEPNEKDTNNCRIYQVCGKKFLETVKTSNVCESLSAFINTYGARAELAAKNQGIDWKAISHAMRAAYQLEQIYTERTITFPLKQAEYLKLVKQGRVDYLSEAAPTLERLMDNIEELSSASDFPEKVDTKFWDSFIIDVISSRYGFK